MFGHDWSGGVTTWFLVSLVLGLWAVFNILQNHRTGPFGKALWSVFVMFVPTLGFIIWLIFGPKATKDKIG
jgi:hypothetical protein